MRVAKKVTSNLPPLFGEAQPTPYEIRATDFVPMPETPLYYRAAAAGSNQPAVLFVNALDLGLEPDIAVFLQQAVPGHHLQSAIQRAREDLPRALTLAMFDRIAAALRPLGFIYVTLDTQGYRSGSMNDVLPVSAIANAR